MFRDFSLYLDDILEAIQQIKSEHIWRTKTKRLSKRIEKPRTQSFGTLRLSVRLQENCNSK